MKLISAKFKPNEGLLINLMLSENQTDFNLANNILKNVKVAPFEFYMLIQKLNKSENWYFMANDNNYSLKRVRKT